MNEIDDWNRKTIEEFRANGGKVGGHFAGAPLLLLHTIGARTSKERVNPMMYQDLGDGTVAVFATKAGAPTHPDWYHNLLATPTSPPRSAPRPPASAPAPPRATNAIASGPSRSRTTPGSPTTRPGPITRSQSSSSTQPERCKPT